MRLTQGCFRWERGHGRKDNYEALLLPRDMEEVHDVCGAAKNDKFSIQSEMNEQSRGHSLQLLKIKQKEDKSSSHECLRM